MLQDHNSYELIAPCGMNCSLCNAYLAYSHEIPQKKGKIRHCKGCRPRKKECSFIKKKCALVMNNQVDFCFQCKDFPCDYLKRIVKGYKKYNYNIIDNLYFIKEKGLESFVKKEQKEYCCPLCGDTVCIHNRKCYTCDRIELLHT